MEIALLIIYLSIYLFILMSSSTLLLADWLTDWLTDTADWLTDDWPPGFRVELIILWTDNFIYSR